MRVAGTAGRVFPLGIEARWPAAGRRITRSVGDSDHRYRGRGGPAARGQIWSWEEHAGVSSRGCPNSCAVTQLLGPENRGCGERNYGRTTWAKGVFPRSRTRSKGHEKKEVVRGPGDRAC